MSNFAQRNEASSDPQEARLKILEMVDQGKISASEAADLLTALGTDAEDEVQQVDTNYAGSPVAEVDSAQSKERTLQTMAHRPEQAGEHSHAGQTSQTAPPAHDERTGDFNKNIKKWRSWWSIPLAIGIGVVALSGWLMYIGFQREWSGFWVGCLWLPLLIGVTLTTLGWLSRTAIWLHVRVNTGEDEWPRRIAISMPIPLRLTAWALKTFGHFIPSDTPMRKLNNSEIDEIVQALSESLQPDDPLYIEVEEEGKGSSQQKVQVFIG